MSQFRGVLSAAVQKRVDIMLAQHKEIMEKLKDGDAAGSLGKDLSNVTPVAKLNDKLDSLRSEEDSMRELLNDAQTSGDKELVSECEEEVQRIEGARDLIEKQLIDAVLPKDEDDKEGAVLEIRAGTGGDEAALFASELLEAYTKTAKTLGWQAEVLSETRTDLGGVKEASIAITGKAGGSLGYDDSGHDDENSKPLASLGPYGFFR
jgi:peptide chain release factor 1